MLNTIRFATDGYIEFTYAHNDDQTCIDRILTDIDMNDLHVTEAIETLAERLNRPVPADFDGLTVLNWTKDLAALKGLKADMPTWKGVEGTHVIPVNHPFNIGRNYTIEYNGQKFWEHELFEMLIDFALEAEEYSDLDTSEYTQDDWNALIAEYYPTESEYKDFLDMITNS